VNLPEAIDTVRSCIVQVRTGGGMGTGFFVNSDAHVITARHVVAAALSHPDPQIHVGMAMLNTRNSQELWNGT